MKTTPKSKRKETRLNVLIGRLDGQFYFLDYVFRDTLHSKPFIGAVGTILRPVPESEAQERRDNPAEYLEDYWQMAVANGDTTQSLEDWAENAAAMDGDNLFYDLSYFPMGQEAAEVYNKERHEEDESADEADDAEFSECIGGGRIFCKDGIHGHTWAEFDKVYADKKTLALIAKHETETCEQYRKRNAR